MHTFGADYFILSDIIYLFFSSICFFKISSKKSKTFTLCYAALASIAFISNTYFYDIADYVMILGMLFLSLMIDPKNLSTNIMNILISFSIIDLSTLIGSSVLTNIPVSYDNKPLFLMMIIWIIETFSSLIIYNISGKIIKKYSAILDKRASLTVALYAYISVTFLDVISHKINIFGRIIPLIITFLIIQCIFVIILFNFELSRHDKLNEQKIKQTEIEGLLKYTEKLEKEERKLRKFKHDYQNMLLSLKELADFEDRNEFKQGVMNLEEYFNVRFTSNEIWGFNDFDNLKNPYLKSIFISKVQDMREQKIIAEFSCPQIIENINIPIFDFVRVIGITLDNSIEAVCGHEDGRILMNISKNDDATKFVISNTMFETQKPIQQLISEGYTSKDNHSGLGLKNINEIQTNNSNLFVSYKYEKNLFVATIIVQE